MDFLDKHGSSLILSQCRIRVRIAMKLVLIGMVEQRFIFSTDGRALLYERKKCDEVVAKHSSVIVETRDHAR